MARRKLTTEDFIRRAKQKHGDLYNYSNVEYKGMNHPVEILCTVHGAFVQSPHTHLYYGGCRKCADENQRKTTPKFIKDAISVHGGYYDYSRVQYTTNATKVAIVCPTHGVFHQLPLNHLAGRGCPSCKYEKKRVDNKKFIERCKHKHKNRYSYVECNYTGIKQPITIRCSIHGTFTQTAGDHLAGSGCPSCARRPYSKKEISWLESFNNSNILHAENTGQVVLPKTNFKVDGFDPTTNTVYEFYGDRFHGNPKIFNPNDTCHPYDKTVTAAILFEQTKHREECIKQLGYSVVTIWESDFDKRGVV